MLSGPWDCEDRDQVMGLLRRRKVQGQVGPSGDVDVQRVDESTFLVSGLGEEQGVATMVTMAAGRVVAMQQISLETPDPRTEAAVAAIRSGDIEALGQVLTEAPDLARIPVRGYQGRTLLHVATDWRGYLPNGPK